MSNDYFTPTGQTTDGKVIVDGVWKFYETEGLPLDVIFDCCIKKGWIPDWIKLYTQMIASGMKHERILSKLEVAICDSFGKDFSEAVISRLDQYFQPKDTK
jgi:alanyl-tRNA synthetase